jgi:ATP-binding cassette, subfamily F, member 3
MISVLLSNVTLILGARAIFRDLTWEIQHDQKIGLIGPNGAGKSSLLKIITGEYSAEPGGSTVRARGVTVGYLSQQPELEAGQSALEAALAGQPRVAEIEAELERVEASLGDPAVYQNTKALQRALAAQQALMDEYDALDGETYAGRVRELLLGLGLPSGDLDKPLGVLSGGQKKLVGLARILLLRPSVLLLDEPDNHLDLPGKLFLEKLIREYAGAVVIVSHDRYLLDAVVTHIVEIEDGKLATFAGDYTSYILDKEERLARQEELFQIQQRKQKRIEEAIKRYAQWVIVSDKFASRLKSMRTQLERFEQNKLDKPLLERRRMDLQLSGWRGSNKVLELRGLSKSFGQRCILRQVDQVIRHGERVGLIGPNGSGKSVLLRLILGIEPADLGEVILGPSVKVGYYAQEHETLDFNQNLIDTVRYASSLSEQAAVAFLIRYLFTYQQSTQKVSQLSGGERSRLQLALLVLSGANFLLLDEPTNNLDIASAEVLEAALDEFVGTVLVISHDRYFLDRTVERILVIEAGRLNGYPGGYSDYLDARGGMLASGDGRNGAHKK